MELNYFWTTFRSFRMGQNWKSEDFYQNTKNDDFRPLLLYMGPDFDRDTLLNGDETSIYVDPPTTASYAPVGSRRVEAVTSGQQKTRVSVCFTATASGKKLKPVILIPRKAPLKN